MYGGEVVHITTIPSSKTILHNATWYIVGDTLVFLCGSTQYGFRIKKIN